LTSDAPTLTGDTSTLTGDAALARAAIIGAALPARAATRPW
jgi:hypothetical protein